MEGRQEGQTSYLSDDGVRSGIGVGDGNGDGNGDVNAHGGMDGAGTRTGTGAGTGRERGRGLGWGPVDERRMGTEARTVAEMGTGTTMTETKIGSGRAEERRKSARNRKIVVDAVRETWETRVGSATYIHKYIYTYIHTYIHKYIHTYNFVASDQRFS